MLVWLLPLLVLVATAGCLCATGVPLPTLLKLFLTLAALFATAVLVARPFLRSKG